MKAKIPYFISIIIISLSLLFFVSPKRDFSENENRYLASFPAFSVEKILSGSFMDSLLDYTTDHFPGRDYFANIATSAIKLTGREEKDGIYFISDPPCLIEGYKTPDNTARISKILGGFPDTGLDQYLMLIPTAVTIQNDRLPSNAPDLLENKTISQLDTIADIYSATTHNFTAIDPTNILLTHKDEYIFYNEDHHWTTLGAYYAYLTFCKTANITPVIYDDFTIEKVSGSFHGTLYSKALDYTLPGDSIYSVSHKDDKLSVFYEDINKTEDSLYNPEFLSKKDQYSYFLNGIHPYIGITNDGATTQRELILIKDSYANSIVPYLAHHFKKIHIFDTRYYKNPVSEFATSTPSATDLLILYNLNTLDSDTGIRTIY